MQKNIFHERREQLFRWYAARNQPNVDPTVGLLPSADEYYSTGYELRASAYLALALAETGQPPAAWELLDRVLGWQDRNPSSLTYGNYFWRTIWKGDPGYVRDPNAVSFIVPALVHLLRRDDMPGELAGRVKESLVLAGQAFLAHRATWGYTNIALLNIAGKLLIGSALEDDRQRRLAYWDWEEWRNHTVRAGLITETFSNTYTYVQLDALAMMLTCPDADPAFRHEVRQAMRHLLTACVQDFHPAIGRVTGTQSRAYRPDRHQRRGSAMDTVLYLLWGERYIDPAIASHLWMGAPFGPEDLLPQGQPLSLPRTTRTVAPGYQRVNRLEAHFTLGSTHCTNHLVGVATPIAVGYEGRSNHCLLSLAPTPKPDGCFAVQDRADLLAALTWQSHPHDSRDEETLQVGEFSGLKTGQPTSVHTSQTFRPGGFIELGPPDLVTICDEGGRPMVPGPIEGTGLALQYDHIHLFWRFIAPGDAQPVLTLQIDPAGELRLNIALPPSALPQEPGVDLSLLGAWVAVEPVAAQEDWGAFITRMARRACKSQSIGPKWRFSLEALEAHPALELTVEPGVDRFYGADSAPISPSRWGLSLQQP